MFRIKNEYIEALTGGTIGFTGNLAVSHHFDFVRYMDNGINALITGTLSAVGGFFVFHVFGKYFKKDTTNIK